MKPVTKPPFKRRTVRKVAALVVGATVLAGCGSAAQNNGTEATRGTSSHNVSFLMWVASNAETRNWDHVISLVEKQYPNVHVKLQTTTFANYWTKVETEASSGTLPCVIGAHTNTISALYTLYRPLGSFIKEHHFNTSAYFASTLKGMTQKGQLYALPLGVGAQEIFYNRALFSKAHLKDPAQGWTANQFLSDAKALTGHGDYGFVAALGTQSLEAAPSWGVTSLMDKNGKIAIDTPAMRAYLAWYGSLVKNKLSPIPPASNPTYYESAFEQGNIGMVVDGPWDLVNYLKYAKFPIVMAPVPAGPAGSRNFQAGAGFGISKSCSDPAAAWEVIKGLTSSQAEKYMTLTGRIVPSQKNEIQFASHSSVLNDKKTMLYSIKTAIPQPTPSTWTVASQQLTNYETLLFSGSMSASHVLAKVQAGA